MGSLGTVVEDEHEHDDEDGSSSNELVAAIA
jgi:hypothetical protein